jgi:CubicO group peptidase (beta-lactamase class C family)
MKRLYTNWFMLLLALLCVSLSAAAQGTLPADLDAYAKRVQEEFEVPGLAVAVVKDGKVVLAKGYGVRKLGERVPVDEHTLFGIASNTKAFTAAALAMLVDEGKLSWDDPVIKHLPSFQMYDPYVTRELTVRDLLTHRSGMGLGAGDLLFWPSTSFTREEIVQRIRFIKPATSFRSRYAYDNILYLVAGEVLRAVSGKTWDTFVQERIFAPLGMTRSNTSTKAFRPSDNIATPHARAEGKLKPIEYMNLDNNAPAGAINSCVAEMAKWLIARLDGGKYRTTDGTEKRLFSQQQNQEMWAAQTILPINQHPPPPLAALKPNFSAYGLGWVLNDYRGYKMVSHTGGLAGLVSRVALVPDLKLGVVVLTNQEEGGAFQAMVYRVLDSFLGAPPTDWIMAYREVRDLQLKAAAEAERQQAGARNAESKPSLPLAKYANTYRDAWYGDVKIGLENGKLVLRFSRTPLLVGDLEHWQYDTFIARWRERSLNADAFVTFALKPDGSIDQMKMLPASPLVDFSYDFQDLLFEPVKEPAIQR